MAKTIVWSKPAATDLERTVAYIFEDSLAYAIAFYNKVREKSRTLSEFAGRGGVVPKHNDKRIREIFVHRHFFVYCHYSYHICY